ncbi:hypothetical protein [Gimesia panareensis]|nr:hypothetical protein [Gimesia panareensis]
MKKYYLLLILTCFTLLISSCSDSGPTRVPVKGRIVMGDDKPIFPGAIAFEPVAGSSFRASSLLYKEGDFDLRTYPHGQGVVPGKYKVVLSLGMGSPPELAKYSNTETTTLEVVVPDTGIESLELKLDEIMKTSQSPARFSRRRR